MHNYLDNFMMTFFNCNLLWVFKFFSYLKLESNIIADVVLN